MFYSTLCILLYYVHVNFYRRPGVPGPPILSLLVIFLLDFFFQSERMTQYQEMHSMLNKKKWGDGLIYIRLKINKLFTFFMISVIFLKMGKHSNFQISSLQVVDVWRILQFNRKNEKYFKEFIWFWGTLSQNYRRLCGSLIMFKKHNLIPVQL